MTSIDDRRRRLRLLLGGIEPVDRALRSMRRTDQVAGLQAQVGALRTELEAARQELERLRASCACGAVAPGEAPGAPWPEVPASVERFLRWFPPGHFYSPVPDLAEVDRDAARLFAPRRTLPGVDLREEDQVALFGKLAALSRADPLPAGPEAGTRYFTDNPNYGVGDASILQAMLRHLRPRRYLEVGSGWSTALALDTSERFLGGTLSVTAIEPYPDLLRDRLRPGDPVTILEAPVQSVPLSRFEELEAGDVLFVDSSHVLKTASDVHFLYTAVLPVLAPGVVVHVHDMFWPFEYLRHWIEEGRAWNECYLVHAFLAHNDAYEVLLFNHFLAQVRPEVLDAELPVMRDNPGGALWLRRRTG
ncbi:MAG: class I SAM-dependent methyltransferase [Actinomycetota bacterium]|nr:class I SAM-dependent methyltransferase [Actinomycetota bacterium]